jgi:hypothetical protein
MDRALSHRLTRRTEKLACGETSTLLTGKVYMRKRFSRPWERGLAANGIASFHLRRSRQQVPADERAS